VSDDLTADVDETTDAPAIEQEVADAPETEQDLGALKRALEHEREERRQAKEELRRIREDETTRAELLKEWGYEVEEEVPDEELFEDDDPVAPLNEKLTRLEQWQQQQEAKEAAAAIRQDLDSFSEGSDWDLDDDDRQAIVERASRQNPNGFGPDELRKAHDWFIARLDRAAEAAVERAKTPKTKAPHVTAAGKPATGTKPIEDMTPDEHRAWARERYQQMNQG
jgi:DNA repair exonuclease SbcCD ATPase subunit